MNWPTSRKPTLVFLNLALACELPPLILKTYFRILVLFLSFSFYLEISVPRAAPRQTPVFGAPNSRKPVGIGDWLGIGNWQFGKVGIGNPHSPKAGGNWEVGHELAQFPKSGSCLFKLSFKMRTSRIELLLLILGFSFENVF